MSKDKEVPPLERSGGLLFWFLGTFILIVCLVCPPLDAAIFLALLYFGLKSLGGNKKYKQPEDELKNKLKRSIYCWSYGPCLEDA
jgi:hypothetical protein